MSIELHCPQCQKLIRAPDDAGGKRGKCPYCKNSMYIPMPVGDDDLIPIAPVDPEEERREAELRRESIKYVSEVAHAAGSVDAGGGSAGGEIDVDAELVAYVLAMHQSDLPAAEAAIVRLRRAGSGARGQIKAAIKDPVLIACDDVPAPLIQGFLKKLKAELG